MYARGYCGGQKRTLDPLKMGLQIVVTLVWVMGIELLRSSYWSQLSKSAFEHWAISLVQTILTFKLKLSEIRSSEQKSCLQIKSNRKHRIERWLWSEYGMSPTGSCNRAQLPVDESWLSAQPDRKRSSPSQLQPDCKSTKHLTLCVSQAEHICTWI